MRDLDERVLDDWCARETYYWSRLAAGTRDFELEFERLNEMYHSVFILDIENGHICVRPKSALSGNMVSTGPQEYERIQLYKDYIEASLRAHSPDLSTTIAIDVHDIPITESDSPVFCFQKTVESRHILLPDVDFMQHGWYENKFDEPPLASKKSHGIFVGSSTGGGNLSCTDIVEARPPRLHLGQALIGHERISFTIAAAVQCDSPQTEALLKIQPYFSPPVSWEDQLQNRFLISIDGNGATCSRVINSLRSQSVLVKFASPNLLFYFHSLAPWRHYIPVNTPQDVERLLDDDAAGKIDTNHIVHQANAFFDRFLTKAAVHFYGAKLLLTYARDVAPKGSPDMTSQRRENGLIAGILTHVANTGDIRSGPGDWAGDPDRLRPIEGISIDPVVGIDPSLLRYRCLMRDGGVTDWSYLGDFSGSRGRAEVVYGLELRLADGVTGRTLVGLIRFANGSVQAMSSNGGLYREEDGSPVMAFKLWFS